MASFLGRDTMPPNAGGHGSQAHLFALIVQGVQDLLDVFDGCAGVDEAEA